MEIKVDINCDLGESFGIHEVGNDEHIMPLVTSCNIACGFHGGDPFHIDNTIRLAIDNGVQMGAHPSYPDLQGFGRRPMKIDLKELKSIIKYQIAAVKGMVESEGATLNHVKAHGALYNTIMKMEAEAEVFVEAVAGIDKTLAVLGQSGSCLQKAADGYGLRFICEGFMDRRYNSDGSLVSRDNENSVIENSGDCVAQCVSMIKKGSVTCIDDGNFNLKVQSLCVHGDNLVATELLRAVHTEFEKEGIKLEPF